MRGEGGPPGRGRARRRRVIRGGGGTRCTENDGGEGLVGRGADGSKVLSAGRGSPLTASCSPWSSLRSRARAWAGAPPPESLLERPC